MSKGWKTDPDGNRHALDDDEEATMRLWVQQLDIFRATHGRNITQSELDTALQKSGLWDRGFRITLPYGRGQA